MILFLRKIRQRLLSEGKIGKYLKYAIGEVFLVVIGILIALQVNNWNTEKDRQQQRDRIVADLEKEISEDLYNDDFLTDISLDLLSQDSILELIVNKRFMVQDYRQNTRLLFPMISNRQERRYGGTSELISYFKLESAVRILDNRYEYPESYKHLLILLKYYQSSIASLEIALEKMAKDQSEFKQFMLDRHPWFLATDSLSFEQAINFTLHDMNYRTRADLFKRNYNFLYRHTTSVKAFRAAILGTLEKLKGGSLHAVKKVFTHEGYQPMKSVLCQDDTIEHKPAGLLQFNPIYNATDHPITVHRLHSNYEINESFEIPAKEFIIWGQSENNLFQFDLEGQCRERFLVKRNSVLIIE